MRASDICARFGGDEFLIFAAGCDLDAATEIARRILNKVEGKRQTLERAGFGVSIGIDIAPLSDAAFERCTGARTRRCTRPRALAETATCSPTQLALA